MPNRSCGSADGRAAASRRLIPWIIAFVTLLAAGYVLIARASFSVLHESKDSGVPKVSSLPPVTIAGTERTVFDWSKDGCSANDYPDLPARAYRDAQGQVQLIMSNLMNRRMSGSSLGRLRHSCDVVLGSDNDPNPARFNDREWIAATYTTDGRTVYALLHNEYQGHHHPGRCPSGIYLKCWYNAITLARSRDGGRSFHHQTPPRHLVASSPYRYVPESGPHGLFAPSNIVRNPRDGRYYALVIIEDENHRAQKRGSCLIRTDDLSNPRSWRAWNGSGFEVRFGNPYRSKLANAPDHVCETVSSNEILAMASSITWSTHFDKWLLIGSSSDRNDRGENVAGIFYSISDDLIHWRRRRLISEVELTWSYQCGDRNPIAYPSLLDPNSASRNFHTAGKRPWLFFTRLHYKDCKMTANRDLVRVPISFR